jgi:hypothetical protein
MAETLPGTPGYSASNEFMETDSVQNDKSEPGVLGTFFGGLLGGALNTANQYGSAWVANEFKQDPQPVVVVQTKEEDDGFQLNNNMLLIGGGVLLLGLLLVARK